MVNRQMNNWVTIDSFVSGSNVRMSFDHSPPPRPPPYPPSRLFITLWDRTTGFPPFNDDDEKEDASPHHGKASWRDLLLECVTGPSVSQLSAVSVCLFLRCVSFLSLKDATVCVCVCVSALTPKLLALLCEDQSPCCYFLLFPCLQRAKEGWQTGGGWRERSRTNKKKKQADDWC